MLAAVLGGAVLLSGCVRAQSDDEALIPLALAAAQTSDLSRNAISVLGYGSTVSLERVMYKDGLFDWDLQSEFSEFDAAGVGNVAMKEMFISVVNQPARASVEYLVLVSAGQNGESKGNANVLTGQAANYKDGFDKDVQRKNRTIDSQSLAYKLMYTPAGYSFSLPSSKTFVALAFDHQSCIGYNLNDHGLPCNDGNRTGISKGFYNWLKKKHYKSKLKMIILAGSSRGGCLSLDVARRFINDSGYTKIPIYVAGFDPVCKEGTDGTREMGASNPHINNPLGNYDGTDASHKTDFSAQYNSISSLQIFNVSDGDEVAIGISGVRPLVDSTNSTSTNWWRGNWYHQIWRSGKHNDLGRSYSSAGTYITSSLNDLQSAWNRMHCSGSSYWNGSSCQTCGTNYYWNGGSCSYCAGSGASWSVAGSCTCSGGRYWTGSSCACPSGTNWTGSYCNVSSGGY